MGELVQFSSGINIPFMCFYLFLNLPLVLLALQIGVKLVSERFTPIVKSQLLINLLNLLHILCI